VADAPGQPSTGAAQFREIDAATVFASSRGESQRWITALADLIADLIADLFADAEAGDRPSDVILRHALRYVDADAALLSMPLDGERMEIRNAAGAGTEGIVGQVYDRRTSIAGRVLDSGHSAFVDMARLKSPLSEVTGYGPMIITPLLGMRALGTLGVARADSRTPLCADDLELVVEFASLATVAMHVDEARAVREEERISAEHDRVAGQLLDSLISRLFRVSMVLAALASSSGEPEQRERLRETAREIDGIIAGVRTTIYATRPGRDESPGL
jgi:signal transduction histidine kinase